MADVGSHIRPNEIVLYTMKSPSHSHMSPNRSFLKFFQQKRYKLIVRRKPYLVLEKNKVAVNCEAQMCL